ncbi:hypothetical protein LCGC14_0588650 [marine sediment metagenome]|uniref:Uncharacterized protein n=1 Tax=marine sediment metagenome TaxID=412755 RepID=A0A0F9U0F8_9ZZZZ
MIIQVDQEANEAIQSLCDVALKIGGIKNLKSVTQTLAAIKPLPRKEEPAEEDPIKCMCKPKCKPKCKGKCKKLQGGGS